MIVQISLQFPKYVSRIIFGTIMMGFLYLICKLPNRYLIAFFLLICTKSLLELLNIMNDAMNNIVTKILIYYTTIMLYITMIIPTLISNIFDFTNYCRLIHYNSIVFYLYILGVLIYVILFKKSIFKNQLLILIFSHSSAIFLSSTFRIAIANLQQGKFYCIYPALLVAANDSGAYFSGKIFGRTTLFDFSPNKTWEGFIGGAIFTYATGWGFLHTKLYHEIIPINSYKILIEHWGIYYTENTIHFFHNLIFIIFASVLAPLGGLIASVIKRYFNKKDFGNCIPGHGGIIDRMDCQFLMIWIVYYFLNGFLLMEKNNKVFVFHP